MRLFYVQSYAPAFAMRGGELYVWPDMTHSGPDGLRFDVKIKSHAHKKDGGAVLQCE